MTGKIHNGIATSKATGERYEYAVKKAWGKRYYSCNFNPEISDEAAPWFATLGEAKRHAIENGYLLRVAGIEERTMSKWTEHMTMLANNQ